MGRERLPASCPQGRTILGLHFREAQRLIQLHGRRILSVNADENRLIRRNQSLQQRTPPVLESPRVVLHGGRFCYERKFHSYLRSTGANNRREDSCAAGCHRSFAERNQTPPCGRREERAFRRTLSQNAFKSDNASRVAHEPTPVKPGLVASVACISIVLALPENASFGRAALAATTRELARKYKEPEPAGFGRRFQLPPAQPTSFSAPTDHVPFGEDHRDARDALRGTHRRETPVGTMGQMAK